MKNIKIVEVGLRDGLQNETTLLSIQQRMDLLDLLIQAGIQNFELGAYVSPKWVPQMACTEELHTLYNKKYLNKKYDSKLHPSFLVPNEQGMLKAIKNKAKEVAVFASASETFSKKNINCTIEESFERFIPIFKLAKQNKVKVRGYLSVCFGCPYEGAIDEKKVIQLATKLYKMGCYEISIGDTIGIANAFQVESIFKKIQKVIPAYKVAGHFHDTRGQALANILAAYQVGIRIFDSSIGGLGGCPYAKGATGNVATEDVLFMFQKMNVNSNINLQKLIQINHWLEPQMNHALSSKVSKVGLGKTIS